MYLIKLKYNQPRVNVYLLGLRPAVPFTIALTFRRESEKRRFRVFELSAFCSEI